jgi:alanyl-tRNA synthetase
MEKAPMTEHLYYHDAFLYDFDATVSESTSIDSRPALILDRTAFYPTSGGQVFDTGWLQPRDSAKLRIVEVSENDHGDILHFLEHPADLAPGSSVRGQIDRDRRRDHMQQHSGQHVLSAAFVKLFNMPTVSFHMGVDSCSIDLDTKSITADQVRDAEALANSIVFEDRPVAIRFVTQQEAQGLGLRKIPPLERDQLRLIDIRDFDLTACGGTHVASTGQIGCILLRKVEKVRQGWRIEFVSGTRAVSTARRDYTTLADAAALCSSHIWDIPQQIRKFQDEARAARKANEVLSEELADSYASRLLAETPPQGSRITIIRIFSDRDLAFIKLLAQRLTRHVPNVVALLAATPEPPAIVFAQSAGQPFDMGALMKEALTRLGGRGGGSKDMAQGCPARCDELQAVLDQIAARLHV